MRRSISIIVPAFNEEKRLPSTLAAVRAFLNASVWEFSEIVVVDDGSHDDTARLAEAAGSRVLRNFVNQGKGYSVRRGMLEAKGDWVLFSDADLSAPIEELETLWCAVEREGTPCAIGSRALDRSLIGVHQPAFREGMGRVFNMLMRLQTGLRFSDTQCGFKLFERSAAREIFGRQRLNGFGFDVEVLFLAARLGFRTVEVPVRWNDMAGTKVGMLVGAKGFLDPLKVRWNGLTGKYGPRRRSDSREARSKGMDRGIAKGGTPPLDQGANLPCIAPLPKKPNTVPARALQSVEQESPLVAPELDLQKRGI